MKLPTHDPFFASGKQTLMQTRGALQCVDILSRKLYMVSSQLLFDSVLSDLMKASLMERGMLFVKIKVNYSSKVENHCSRTGV